MPDQRHYERAFDAYLRSLRVRFNSLNETRRSIDDPQNDTTLKTFDFLVYNSHNHKLLVDVKGRKLSPKRSTLESWSTIDDIDSLARWQEIFGADTTSLLVFVYHLAAQSSKMSFDDCYTFQDRRYGFLGISLTDYRQHKKRRSSSWRTVDLPQAKFREYAKPLTSWL